MKTSSDPKDKRRNMRSEIFVASIVLGSFAPSAFAYLDPSTGSMILSAIVGIFATVGLAVKTYWYKLKSLFGGSKSVQSDVSGSATSAEISSEKESGSAGN